MDGRAISFGPFRLFVERRLLLEGDTPARLGNRAFDILAALVERAGEVVGKQELMARVWQKTFVEESNLKMQVSALRRALGDGQGGRRFVANIPGRGYSFVAPISFVEPPQAAIPAATMHVGAHNLPYAATRMIGREEAMAALASRLSSGRIVTIVGPGGIGKTTVALAVAERLIGSYGDGVWLVDLAPLGDPRLVPSAVATVLGLGIRTENPLPSLVAGLRDRRLLLVLDTCEHVIDAVAALGMAVLRSAPGVTILATSRERLNVAGEAEYRLGPLSSPQPSSRLTAADASAFPAVQLFVERVKAIIEDFALTDTSAQPVVEICRRLDGLPLAIEFAAPQVAALGVESLAARLDDTLPLLGARGRKKMPRHRTMQAVIDWSYNLLSEDEQRFFRALGIFSGGLTAEAAAAVGGEADGTGFNSIDRLADLVSKSLVVADVSGAALRFRLLDTTRAFAIDKLGSSGEHERIARGHAEYYRSLFERAETEVAVRPRDKWLADYVREIDNLRAALDWAFSSHGDAAIAISLTIATIPLWIELSQFPECRLYSERAIAILDASVDPRGEMHLYSALAASLFHTKGPVRETHDAWRKALRIAEVIGATEYQLRAVWGIWSYRLNSGEFNVALARAEDFVRLAGGEGNRADLAIGDRMMGTVLHYLGDQPKARRLLERMLEGYATPDARSDIIRFQLEPRVATRSVLARTLWLLGFAEQALQTAEQNVEHAVALGHAVTLYNSLLAAGQVALLSGDLAAATRYVAMLQDHSSRHAMGIWTSWADGLQGVLRIQQGDAAAGLPILRAALEELGEARSVPRFAVLFGAYATGLAQSGQIAEGLAAIGEALEHCQRNDENWIMPELLRVKGALMERQGLADSTMAAEDLYLRSLDVARGQGAVSWQLRTAISLARLWNGQRRAGEARELLSPIYDRFTEGFATADLQTAKALLGPEP